MKHLNTNNPDKNPGGFTPDEKSELAKLVSEAEDEQKKHLSIPDMLKNYKEVDWLNWIDDMLKYDHAYPDTFRRSGDHDGIGQVSSFFESHNLSSEEYQKALLTSLCSHVSLLSQNQDVSGNMYRLVNALQGFTSNDLGQKLHDMFIDPANDDITWHDYTVTQPVYIKSNILSMLSNSNLDSLTKASVITKAIEYIQMYIKTPYYCSAILKFTIRQSGKIPDLFFHVLVLILQVTKNDGFELLKVDLIDALESYQFLFNSFFNAGFNTRYELICKESGSEKFNAEIKKYLV